MVKHRTEVRFFCFQNHSVRLGAVYIFGDSYVAVRFSLSRNPTARFGAFFLYTVRCGAVRCVFIYQLSYGAVRCRLNLKEPYGAVRRGYP